MRNWKKATIVILSLMLPVMILNAIFIIQKGFDYDKFISAYISSDFNVSGCTNNAATSNFQSITPEVRELLEQRPEVEEVAYVYNTKITHSLDENGYNNLAVMIEKMAEEGIIEGRWLEKERAYLAGRKVVCNIMGIDQVAFNKMEFSDETASWETFCQGDSIIVGEQAYRLGQYYKPGDRVNVSYGGNGAGKEYKVLALGDLPRDMPYPFSSGTYFDYSFYVPEAEYKVISGNENAMRASVEIQDGMEEQFGAWLDSIIKEKQLPLYVDSILTLEEDCKQFSNQYYLILGALGGVIFIIGVVNFFNTSAVSILSRKRELSLLEAVGMTKRQIQGMLLHEGMFYLLMPVLLADTVGIPVVRWIVENTVGETFYFTYQLNLTASFLILPVLMVIASAVPLFHYRQMCRATIVERIRIEEGR